MGTHRNIRVATAALGLVAAALTAINLGSVAYLVSDLLSEWSRPTLHPQSSDAPSSEAPSADPQPVALAPSAPGADEADESLLVALAPRTDPPASAPPAEPLSDQTRPLEPREKISPDILQMLEDGLTPLDEPIPLILQAYVLWGDRSRIASLVEEHGGSVDRQLECIEGLSVTLPLGDVLSLAESDDVWRVSRDAPMLASLDVTVAAVGADQVWNSSGPGRPGFDGTGVGICVIDTGGNKTLRDFAMPNGINSRVRLSKDFTRSLSGADDQYGHGVHVAGIAAGNGARSSGYGKKYSGVAPGASIISLRVLDRYGMGFTSDVIAAIDWAVANKNAQKIGVINLSLGHPVYESFYTDPLTLACRRAVEAEIVVVVSAGNNGSSDGHTVYGGINSPGNAPWVITVGATDTQGTVDRSDDTIAWFSSRGPTVIDGQLKPDIVAPGRNVVSVLQPACVIATHYPDLVVQPPDRSTAYYLRLSGTSMAAPVVAGTVALMLQANPSLTPNAIKSALMYTAEKMTMPNLLEQGAGYLNVEGAVRMASSITSDSRSNMFGRAWLVPGKTIEPVSYIAGDAVFWGSSFIWGRSIIWGKNVSNVVGALWGGGTMWSDAILWRQSSMWGDGLIEKKQYAYGSGILWRSSTSGSEAILWRQSTPWTEDTSQGEDCLYGSTLGPSWVGKLVDPLSILPLGIIDKIPLTHYVLGPIGAWYYPPLEMIR